MESVRPDVVEEQDIVKIEEQDIYDMEEQDMMGALLELVEAKKDT